MTMSIGSAAATTPFEMVALATAEAGDASARASLEERRVGREMREEAQAAQIRDLREAADQEMIAGILGGVGTIASGLAQVGSGASGLGRGSLAADATQVEQQNARGEAETATAFWNGAGGTLKGGFETASAAVSRDAKETRARATAAEQRARTAGDVVSEASEDLRARVQAEDRMTQSLGEVLGEQQRAAMAATRA